MKLGNLEGPLKNDKEQRRKTVEMITTTFDLRDGVFAKPVVANRDHINPFLNIDFRISWDFILPGMCFFKDMPGRMNTL